MYENSSDAIQTYIEKIIKLSKEVEIEDQIDLSMLETTEDNVYRLIARNVVNQFDIYTLHERQTMIATITKLIFKNFVLNLKLKKAQNGN